MTHIIAEPCINVKDRACVPACPVDCIYEGEQQLWIKPEECIDCGACVEPCPVQAIFPEDELPEKWKHFKQTQEEFFAKGGGAEGPAKPK